MSLISNVNMKRGNSRIIGQAKRSSKADNFMIFQFNMVPTLGDREVNII